MNYSDGNIEARMLWLKWKTKVQSFLFPLWIFGGDSSIEQTYIPILTQGTIPSENVSKFCNVTTCKILLRTMSLKGRDGSKWPKTVLPNFGTGTMRYCRIWCAYHSHRIQKTWSYVLGESCFLKRNRKIRELINYYNQISSLRSRPHYPQILELETLTLNTEFAHVLTYFKQNQRVMLSWNLSSSWEQNFIYGRNLNQLNFSFMRGNLEWSDMCCNNISV